MGSKQVWKELREGKTEFQKILALLIEFDEKTGRHRKYGEPETHYMRTALAVCDSSRLRIFAKYLGGFLYHVVGELRGTHGNVVTGWLHEDGIQGERVEQEGKQHPVHEIVCITDLVGKYGEELKDTQTLCVLSETKELLT